MVVSKKSKEIFFGIVLVIVLLLIVFFALRFGSNGPVFSKTSLIKMNLPFDGEIGNTIRVSNPTDEGLDFKVFFSGLDGIAFSDQSEFYVRSSEYEEVNVVFKGVSEPGVYLGSFVIQGDSRVEKIPVILGVEDPTNSFAIVHESIPKYENIQPGEKFGLEVKIFDLLSRDISSINSEYFVKNFEGETLIQGNSNLAVGGSTTEIIDIPESWEEGNYVFISTINYDNSTAFSTYLFSISERAVGSFFYDFRFLVAVTLIMFLLVFAIIFYFIKTRDEILIQLKDQHSYELKKSMEYFSKAKEEVEKSKEEQKQKQKRLKALSSLKKKVTKKIKLKHVEQKKQVKKLKKTKKKSAVQKQVDKWKNQGYGVDLLEKETKKISKGNIDKELKNLNKQGYDTSFLE